MIHTPNQDEETKMRTNQYPGACATCTGRVGAGEGSLERGPSGWQVRHNGTCPPVTQAPAQPKRDKPAECGLYRHDDKLYVVREFTPEGEDRKVRYARELVATTGSQADRARAEDGTAIKLRAIKAPRMQWVLTTDEAVTIEEAKALGIKFGECLICGTAIETKASVEDRGGIGPVCFQKQTRLVGLAA